jgi:hypothetical protein
MSEGRAQKRDVLSPVLRGLFGSVIICPPPKLYWVFSVFQKRFEQLAHPLTLRG